MTRKRTVRIALGALVYLAVYVPLFALYWVATPSPHSDALPASLIFGTIGGYLAFRTTRRWSTGLINKALD